MNIDGEWTSRCGYYGIYHTRFEAAEIAGCFRHQTTTRSSPATNSSTIHVGSSLLSATLRTWTCRMTCATKYPRRQRPWSGYVPMHQTNPSTGSWHLADVQTIEHLY